MTATTNAWSTGLPVPVTITDTGTAALDGWQLGFTLPSGQTVTGGWGAAYSPASGAMTATDTTHNAATAPGASISIGCRANRTGNGAAPSAYSLNGTVCTRGWARAVDVS